MKLTMWKVPKEKKCQKIGKEKENSFQKMKRSLDESHTQTHGNLTEIFSRGTVCLYTVGILYF